MSVQAARRKRFPRNAGGSFTWLVIAAFLAGCGAPGEPTPPAPVVPERVSDLAARQSGDGVQLTFTLPTRSTEGDRLAEPPAVEIFRGAMKADGSPEKKSFRVVYTIPGALVDTYASDSHVRFTDPISADEIAARPGTEFAYRVRTRADKRKVSEDSNTVVASVYPVAEKIASVSAQVTPEAIELSWAAPAHTASGAPVQNVAGYRVYRGEIDPASASAAAKDLTQAGWQSPLALLAPAPSATYRDTFFDFGKTYLYTVRSVVIANGESIESGDSTPLIVTPRDTFPPAAPQGLVAAVLEASLPQNPEVDLSWSLNVEPDLAGYRVYRSEQEGMPGVVLTRELLPTPTYRDTSVQPGHRYWYTVTAVDRAGNESAMGSAATADVPQPKP